MTRYSLPSFHDLLNFDHRRSLQIGISIILEESLLLLEYNVVEKPEVDLSSLAC